MDNYLRGIYLSVGSQQQDATSSAIQLIGILRKLDYPCHLSNVTGDNYTDIYGMFSNLFFSDVLLVKKFYENNLTPLVTSWQKGTLTQQLLYSFITDTKAWQIHLDDPTLDDLSEISSLLHDIRFPAVSLGKINLQLSPIDQIISRIRLFIESYPLLNIVPEKILRSRNLTKPVIMTLGYNAGEISPVDERSVSDD